MNVRNSVVPVTPRVPGNSRVHVEPGKAVANPPITRFTSPPGEGEDEGAGGAFAIADLDQKPRPILQPAPQYPYELRQKKIEGTVSVLFIVDETGRVVNPKIETSPNPGFERPVLEALRQWRFEAAVRGGKKVAARMRIPIRFSASQS